MLFSRDNLIALGVLVALTAAYFLVVYRGQSAALAEVRAETAQKTRRLDEDTRRATRLPPMVRQVEAMKQRYNKDWDRRLPQRQELADFLREIASNLAQEQLSNQIIQPGNPTRGPLYNCLPIKMKFEGDFLALTGFLKHMDGVTRLTRVEYLRIDPSVRAGKLSIELGMNIHFTEQ